MEIEFKEGIMSHSIESQLLSCDMSELYGLTMNVGKHPSNGVLALGLLPFATFIVVESYDWLRRSDATDVQPFLEAQAPRIRRMRACLKLLSAHPRLADHVRLFQAIELTSTEMFRFRRFRLLEPLLRRKSCNLGIYYSGDDVFCTTHVAMVNMGYTHTDVDKLRHASASQIGIEMHDISIELGKYIGQVMRLMSASLAIPCSTADLDIAAEDCSANVIYGAIDQRLGHPDLRLAALFSWLASQVNYVHHVLRALMRPESDLFLRYRFLTAFHTLQALRIVQSVLRGDRASQAGRIVIELTTRPGAKRLLPLTKLRNALAHYGLSDIVLKEGSMDPISQMAVQLAQMGRTDLNQLLDSELEALSASLREILPKGKLGGVPASLSR